MTLQVPVLAFALLAILASVQGFHAEIGGSCSSDSNCQSGNCDGGVCQACTTNDQCLVSQCSTSTCTVATGICTECCGLGLDCLSNNCVGGFCAACTTTTCTNSCAFSICLSNEQCSFPDCCGDRDCFVTGNCQNGVCQPCTSNEQCVSGTGCSDSTCPQSGDCTFPDSCFDGPPDFSSICFSGRSKVQVQGEHTATRMDELKIGDKVLGSDGQYTKIYSFGHYQPNVESKFLQIRSATHSIEISVEHMLFIQEDTALPAKAVPAGSIKVGDYLVTEQGLSQVLLILNIKTRGAFAPLTTSGTIVVDGVLASNYVSRDWLPDTITGQVLHWLQHGAVLPYRLFCKTVGCENETYDKSMGFSPWVQFWFRLEAWQLQANIIVRGCFLAGLVVPATMAVLVGMVLDTPLSALVPVPVHVFVFFTTFFLWSYAVKMTKQSCTGKKTA